MTKPKNHVQQLLLLSIFLSNLVASLAWRSRSKVAPNFWLMQHIVFTSSWAVKRKKHKPIRFLLQKQPILKQLALCKRPMSVLFFEINLLQMMWLLSKSCFHTHQSVHWVMLYFVRWNGKFSFGVMKKLNLWALPLKMFCFACHCECFNHLKVFLYMLYKLYDTRWRIIYEICFKSLAMRH